jgi:hypothetical protein
MCQARRTRSPGSPAPPPCRRDLDQAAVGQFEGITGQKVRRFGQVDQKRLARGHDQPLAAQETLVIAKDDAPGGKARPLAGAVKVWAEGRSWEAFAILSDS